MASESNPAVPQCSSEVQDYMGDAHSKDLEHSKSTQQELFKDDYIRCSPTSLEHSSASSSRVLEATVDEQTNFTETTTDDPAFIINERKFDATDSFLKETPSEITKISSAHQVVSTLHSEKANVIQSDYPEVTKSSESTQSIYPDDAELTEIILPPTSEETESTEIVQSSIAEETESAQVVPTSLAKKSGSSQVVPSFLVKKTELAQAVQSSAKEDELAQVVPSSLAEETESAQVVPSYLAEENKSAQVVQSSFSKETESPRVVQPSLAKETKSGKFVQSHFSMSAGAIKTYPLKENTSNKTMQPIIFENDNHSKLIQIARLEKTELNDFQQRENLTDVTPFVSLESSHEAKAPLTLSDSVTSHIMINTSDAPGIVPKELSEILNDFNSFEENSISKTEEDNFLALLETEEYKNGTHIVIPGKGQVIVAPTIPCEPMYPDFVMPELYSPTETPLESINKASPTKDTTVSKDIYLDRSLYSLLSLLQHWIQTGIEKNYIRYKSLGDFINFSKRELQYGLDLLKQTNKRINFLLEAVVGLPDPTIFKSESGNLKISNRYILIDAGVKVQRKLKILEAETAESFKIFVNFASNSAQSNEEFGANKAKEMLLKSFIKLSEDYLTLNEDVDTFRQHIREFCLEIDRLLC